MGLVSGTWLAGCLARNPRQQAAWAIGQLEYCTRAGAGMLFIQGPLLDRMFGPWRVCSTVFMLCPTSASLGCFIRLFRERVMFAHTLILVRVTASRMLTRLVGRRFNQWS